MPDVGTFWDSRRAERRKVHPIIITNVIEENRVSASGNSIVTNLIIKPVSEQKEE